MSKWPVSQNFGTLPWSGSGTCFQGRGAPICGRNKTIQKQANKLLLAIDREPLLDPSEGVRELVPTGFSSIAYMDAMKLL